MKKQLFFIFLSLTACRDSPVSLETNNIAQDKYYTSEIIPESLRGIYGKWKLVSVSGGFSGSGVKPNFDYLEIREFGIYGIVKDQELVEVGKIELNTFDPKSKSPQVEFIIDSAYSTRTLGGFSYKYMELGKKKNELKLVSSCCDAYDHHFERVR